MYQDRFTYETVSQYPLHFHVVFQIFSILDLCATVIKAGSVTVTHPFQVSSGTGEATLGELGCSVIWITLCRSQRPFIVVKMKMSLKMSKGKLR